MKDLTHTPRQKPIEAPFNIIASSMTLSKMCARGRYDRYTSFSFSCRQEKNLGMLGNSTINIHYPKSKNICRASKLEKQGPQVEWKEVIF